MFNQISTSCVARLVEKLEHNLRQLPIQKKPSPTSPFASPVEAYIRMIRVDDAVKVVASIADLELQGVTSLLDKFIQKIVADINGLPVTIFKLGLTEYDKLSTLSVEVNYVELEDVIQLIKSHRYTLESIEKAIIEYLCHLIMLKSERLLEATKHSADLNDVFPEAESLNLPKLEGNREALSRASVVRRQAVDEFLHLASAGNLAQIAMAHGADIITKMTSAAWWMKNEHRTTRAILLLIGKALDEELLVEFARVRD